MYGASHGHIRTVVTHSEDEDSAVLTLFRIGDRCSGVRQRSRIGEAAREDWQQHTDQQCSSVHDGPPYDESWSAGLFGDTQSYHAATKEFLRTRNVDRLDPFLLTLECQASSVAASIPAQKKSPDRSRAQSDSLPD